VQLTFSIKGAKIKFRKNLKKKRSLHTHGTQKRKMNEEKISREIFTREMKMRFLLGGDWNGRKTTRHETMSLTQRSC
jgi:hypothetical protein